MDQSIISRDAPAPGAVLPAALDQTVPDAPGKRLKVLFFTNRLGGGGAEKHMLRVINHLDQSRFAISVALVKPSGSFESALSPDVNKFILNHTRTRSTTARMIRSIKLLRRIIEDERPDLVFSVIDLANLVNVMAATKVRARPKIVLGVQTPPAIAYGSWHPVSRLILTLIPRLYPKADQIVALSHGVAESLAQLAPQLRQQTTVIHNAGVEDDLLEKMREELLVEELPHAPLIVACGRLKALKGFGFLIDALKEVRQTTPANLLIVGEGEERAALERKIRRLQLQDCVRLVGFQENPFKYMAAADLFVLSSLFEGFGNVIVEAMACGVPVVATDCPYGPREIIADGVNGILVELGSAPALAQAILRVLGDSKLSNRLAENGKQRAQDFEAKSIADTYGKLFMRVAGQRGENIL
jgi:glycosyltransferase involved in cell wall biosynthesis